MIWAAARSSERKTAQRLEAEECDAANLKVPVLWLITRCSFKPQNILSLILKLPSEKFL